MSPSFRSWLIVAACAGFGAACHEGANGAPDGGSGVDAAPAADAMTSPETQDIQGTWSYTLGQPGSADEIACDATISLADWAIACPITGLPYNVGPGCDEIAAQWKIHGSLFDRLDGQVDHEDTYAGDGCPALGYQTGLPVVSTVGVLSATHDVRTPHGGFWSAVGGDWSFVVLSPDNPLQQQTCAAHIGALGGWSVECATGSSAEIFPGCTETMAIGLDGHVTTTALDGSIYQITRYTGETCAPTYPPEIKSTPVPMSAMRR